MDQSSSDFFRWTREESMVITCFSDFGYLDPFRRYSRSKSEVVWNRAEFCMFLAPNFFGGRAPEFLDLHYQEHTHIDHVAKFRGDRPTELGGSPANKKTSAVKHKAFGTNVPGGLISNRKQYFWDLTYYLRKTVRQPHTCRRMYAGFTTTLRTSYVQHLL